MWFPNFTWFHKGYDFHGMLLSQARASEEGSKLLAEFMHHPSGDLGETIDGLEKQADELRRQLIFSLNKTLVPPFDREDIFALSRAIDDMIDYANTTVEEMVLFDVQPNVNLRKMADALYQASQHITQAVSGLRGMNAGVHEHIIRAKKSENLIEHLYREALADLFKHSDLIWILKMREIYRHLSNAADRGDEAANILSDILMKNS